MQLTPCLARSVDTSPSIKVQELLCLGLFTSSSRALLETYMQY